MLQAAPHPSIAAVDLILCALLDHSTKQLIRIYFQRPCNGDHLAYAEITVPGFDARDLRLRPAESPCTATCAPHARRRGSGWRDGALAICGASADRPVRQACAINRPNHDLRESGSMVLPWVQRDARCGHGLPTLPSSCLLRAGYLSDRRAVVTDYRLRTVSSQKVCPSAEPNHG